MEKVIRYNILFLILASVVFGLSTELLQAQSCQGIACARFETRNGLLNSTEVLLTNVLNSAYLGENVVLNQSQQQALLDSDVEMNALVAELMAITGANTVQELTNESITASDFIGAAESVITDPVALQALSTLAQTGNASSGTLIVGDFLDISLINLGNNNGSLNLSDLVDGVLSHVYYSNYQGSTPIAISLTGAELGLGIANQVDAYVLLTNPATITCSGEGATFYSASTRIKLVVDLVDMDKTSTLDALLNTLGVSILPASNLDLSLGQVELYIDVSKAEGEITAINTATNEVEVQVIPTVADVYLGSIDENLFFSNNALNPAVDLDFANIGTLGLSIPNPLSTVLAPLPDIDVNVLVQAKAYTDGTGTANTETLTFSGPFPETQTAGDSENYIANLLQLLLSTNFELKLEIADDGLSEVVETLVNTTLNTLLPVVDTVVTDALADEILGPILNTVVDPLLRQITGPIGEADVVVDGLYEYCEVSISGNVYLDENLNYQRDGSEVGTGESIYAKLIDETNPSMAVSAVLVSSSTGVYQLSNAPSGSYTVIIDDNNTLSDVTPSKPSGWISTQTEDLSWPGIKASSQNISEINFGLYEGSIISGISFIDNGEGGGAAYNGAIDGSERKVYNSTILLKTEAGVIVDETTSNYGGQFHLYIPKIYDNTTLIVQELENSRYYSVSGSPGTTNGSYTLEIDQVSFVNFAGNQYQNVRFGNVEVATFSPNGQQYATPGSVIFYPHVFKASSEGQVEFTPSGVSSSSNATNWSVLLYEDLNCNGSIDASEPIIETKSLTAGEQVCILAKVFVPVQSSFGESYTLTIVADFDLQGTGITHSSKVTDITIVSDATGAGLRIEKSVDKATAFPGEEITYTLTYFNSSSEPVSQISINDATPAYTTFVSASCDETPSEITACTITAPLSGEAGSIEWVITGEFLPGRTMKVSYKVLIQ